ncbi:Secreted protein [Nostoc sp. DSM 114161]|jgi:hypothetical protein|uniref:hypothetical protein n=1 Tax=Nostoc sp. DSM 114161 TaxID=3440143 RepID=UPI0040465C72
MINRKCIAFGFVSMLSTGLAMGMSSVSASFGEKVQNNSIMLAQIGLTNTQVTISPEGFDPNCGAFRATVSTNWGTYTACYYNQSNKQISGFYTLYYYNQPGGVWYSFDNGDEQSYVKWDTVARQ